MFPCLTKLALDIYSILAMLTETYQTGTNPSPFSVKHTHLIAFCSLDCWLLNLSLSTASHHRHISDCGGLYSDSYTKTASKPHKKRSIPMSLQDVLDCSPGSGSQIRPANCESGTFSAVRLLSRPHRPSIQNSTKLIPSTMSALPAVLQSSMTYEIINSMNTHPRRGNRTLAD